MGEVNKGKLLSFRCPKCKRLLFKCHAGASTLDYKDPGMRHFKSEETGKMIVECSKCYVVLEVTPHGLIEFVRPKAEAAGAGILV